jgi:RimJ/RimL family protein N-acetyltransferase
MPERPASPPDPPLSDGVVTLRPWTEADVPAIVAACSDEELGRWLDTVPRPYTEAHAQAYVAHAERGWRGEEPETPFAIADAATGEPLGSIGVRWQPEHAATEIGYWVRRESRGRGVATRATRLVAAWVLGELGFERLQLQADALNVASCLVAERAGFTLDGTLRSARRNARQDRRVDVRVYSLLRGEL